MSFLVYSPEDFGVEIVYEHEVYTPDYSFDTLLVVRDLKDGKLYAATDSGCSCPVPFEDHVFPTDFTEVRSWSDVKDVLDAAYPTSGSSFSRNRMPLDGLRRAVRAAVA